MSPSESSSPEMTVNCGQKKKVEKPPSCEHQTEKFSLAKCKAVNPFLKQLKCSDERRVVKLCEGEGLLILQIDIDVFLLQQFLGNFVATFYTSIQSLRAANINRKVLTRTMQGSISLTQTMKIFAFCKKTCGKVVPILQIDLRLLQQLLDLFAIPALGWNFTVIVRKIHSHWVQSVDFSNRHNVMSLRKPITIQKVLL